MYRIFFAFLLAAFCCILCAAADSSLLPDQFGPWHAEAPFKTLRVHDLAPGWANWPNGEHVLQEAGLSKIEQGFFRSGHDEVSVRIFVLRDPSSAYELYTFLLAPGMKDLGLGKDSAREGDMPVLRNAPSDTITPIVGDGPSLGYSQRAVVLIGNFVVQTNIPIDVGPESLKELVTQLQAKADPTPLPPLKSYLPEHWRVFGSEKYALGPEAFKAAMTSLNQGANAGLA